MALDATQKASIRRYLGYPDPSVNTLQRFSLEGNMDEVSAEGEVEIEAILTRLGAIETKYTSVRAYAGLKRAEDVEFYGGGEALVTLGDEGNSLVDQLARILGVDVLAYPFPSRRICGGIARRGA